MSDIYIAPGDTFESSCEADTDLLGSIGVQIDDSDGNPILARTTAGITETVLIANVRSEYTYTGTSGEDWSGDYQIIWDDTASSDYDTLHVGTSGSFTYDLTTPVGQVRFEIGDTNLDEQLFSDEEITFKLTENADSVLATAAALCDILAIRFARDYDFKWKDGEFKRSQRADHFKDLGAALRARIPGNTLGVIETGRIDAFSQDIDARDTQGVAPPYDHDFELID